MYTCCAERRIGSQKRLRRRSGDQVSQQQAHRINNSEMNVAKKKRWLRGGELLESRDIYLKEEFPQRLILSCICSITVSSDLTLFFTSTCIYLHLLAHIYTLQHIHHITSRHITSHHITFALPYKMFQELFAVWETLWVSSSPCFPCYLQRIGCSISHLARCFHCF